MLKSFIEKMADWLVGIPKPTGTRDFIFQLRFRTLMIGELRFDGKAQEWVFAYSKEFREQKDVAPLVDFPNLDREHRSKTLWPFFAMRIPSLEQPAVREMLAREHREVIDEVTLLKTFGRTSVSNPFDLIPVPA